jgi:UDP-GlcNAc:undecaprenyl-phosphate GlcNAc-1-phosphate transferase
MEPFEIAVPLFVAFGAALAITPLVQRLATALGAVDRPSARGVSQRPDMPLLGGLAVGIAFAAGLGVALWLGEGPPTEHRLRGLVLGGGLMLALGVLDDRFGLSAWSKFSVQLLAAAIAIVHGFQIDRLTDPITLTLVNLPVWLSWLATIVWIVGVTNAINLLDGLDGLATGVSAIIAATLTFIAWQAGAPFGVCVGIALIGALLGFLPHNFSPARIFLGDTGALFIGYTLALLALEGYRRISLLTFVVPLLALAVPILDTTLSIVRRMRLHTPVFSADRLHMHHRLLATEGSARAAVLQFYFLTAAFCLIAVSFTRLRGITAALFLTAVIGLTLRLLYNLGALSFRGEDPEQGDSESQPEPEAEP